MKRLIALMFVALPAFANIVDSTYVVTPPVRGTQCPAIQPGLTYPCAYVAIGGYTDTYQFIVVDDTLPYSFEVTSSRWRRCVLSGRAHPCYTESNTIINAVVLDAAGNGVLQLVNTSVDTSSDDWIGSAQLPPGDYALVISGGNGGNRPGLYGYSITFPVPPPPPVQLPLAPLTLLGSATCDADAVCTFTPDDASAVTSVVLELANNLATLNPAVDPAYAGTITSLTLVAIGADGMSVDFAGTASVANSTDSTQTLAVSFAFSFVIDPTTSTGSFTNWVVSTQ
jgi:hypothetical protein